jgi:hypothetical protein
LFKSRLQTILLMCVAAALCAAPVPSFANPSYDAIIASARTGAHSQAIEALREWKISNPQDKRVDSDLVVVMGWAGLDADALAVAKASGSNALEPYALRSAAKSARNQQDHAWALEAYNLLLAKDPKDCDALLGIANSQVDLRATDPAGNTLTQLENICASAPDWPLRIAQARTYWSARQKNDSTPKDLNALAWWTAQMEPSMQAAYPVAYRNARVREAVLVASRTGSHQLASTWLARAESTMGADERASVLAAVEAQRQGRQIRCTYDANRNISCAY